MRLAPAAIFASVCLQAAPSLAVKAHVDRTAIYPGDRLEYTVTVEHPPSVEFIADHLSRDQLALDPFEILDIDAKNSGPSFQVTLHLRTFQTGDSVISIPSFTLFYFERGAASKDNAAAETLPVPAFSVGLHSTIADPNAPIRDSKPVLAIAQREWLLPATVGICGLLASAAYLLWAGARWLRSASRKDGAAREIHRRSFAESLDEIRHSRVDSPENAEEFYRKAADLLRGIAAGTPGEGAWLTPREAEAALRAAGGAERHSRTAGDLLEECDRVRYAPGGLEQGASQHDEFLRRLEDLVQRR
ncbi:MAG TPA: hypothetical protein VKB88_33140 [Bryobacteraceae bacterium]|nr:hypothetical protein [Bryobacteraceae bacterium]